ncbi:SPOR domain-containing protein [Sphingomonas crusticola]|uniref:SPOR domain-containing protein n=1 Tax=Sphingomonas crusticola TaxID=1697973 RepID=UPI0013C36168|nr:SPOR domain-containing protein [Sphingomonas crusticola]
MHPRSMFLALAFVASMLALTAPVAAQEEVLQPVEAPQALAPNALQLAQAAAARGDSAEALSRYLRILATTPDDVNALIGAGRAALAVGDTNAAAGFLSRADVLDSRNGQVKAGLGSTMLANGNARAALRLFNDAVALGVPPTEIAADRGLAYDLRGAPKRAQADYALALRLHPSDETTRRLALSQAIAGDRVSALATLDPLLRKQDVPAWRDRVFVYALTGDLASAQQDAALVMPADQVAALGPYLPRLAALKMADKAAAIHLGRFPGETPPEPKPVVIAAPRIQVDRATLTPAAPVQSFAEVKAAATTPAPVTPARAPAPETAAAALPVRAERAPAPSRAQRPPGSSRSEDMPSASQTAAPAAPTRAELAAEAKLEAKARAAEKRKADALAAAKAKREQEEEERAVARKNPARHWVQVAGGANKADLGREWAKLKAKWPTQLAGRSPWTTHYRFTNRLLIGPFATSAAAQDWVGDRKKEGFATFRVETAAGDPVERVD